MGCSGTVRGRAFSGYALDLLGELGALEEGCKLLLGRAGKTGAKSWGKNDGNVSGRTVVTLVVLEP